MARYLWCLWINIGWITSDSFAAVIARSCILFSLKRTVRTIALISWMVENRPNRCVSSSCTVTHRWDSQDRLKPKPYVRKTTVLHCRTKWNSLLSMPIGPKPRSMDLKSRPLVSSKFSPVPDHFQTRAIQVFCNLQSEHCATAPKLSNSSLILHMLCFKSKLTFIGRTRNERSNWGECACVKGALHRDGCGYFSRMEPVNGSVTTSLERNNKITVFLKTACQMHDEKTRFFPIMWDSSDAAVRTERYELIETALLGRLHVNNDIADCSSEQAEWDTSHVNLCFMTNERRSGLFI